MSVSDARPIRTGSQVLPRGQGDVGKRYQPPPSGYGGWFGAASDRDSWLSSNNHIAWRIEADDLDPHFNT